MVSGRMEKPPQPYGIMRGITVPNRDAAQDPPYQGRATTLFLGTVQVGTAVVTLAARLAVRIVSWVHHGEVRSVDTRTTHAVCYTCTR